MIHIPKGSSAEDVKARKKLIGDFYSKWCAENPAKRIWNKSLKAYIHVKYHSINETKGQADVKKVDPRKANDRNQRPYDKMILLRFREINLIVGHQKKTDEYVQYCITAKK